MATITYLSCILVAVLCYCSATTVDCPAPSNCECTLVFHDRLKTTMSALDCSGQNFTVIPQLGYQTYNKLYTVSFADNRIASIHRVSFPKVAYLKRLILDGNPISYVHPDAFRFIRPTLQELDLANTGFDMRRKPWFLKDLHKLKTLILDGNVKHPVVPANIFHGLNLNALRKLTLQHCRLTSLEVGAFVGLERLEVLDLRYNLLTTLSSGLWDLVELKLLYADYNDVKYIADGSLRGMPNLLELHMSHNRLDSSDAIAEGAFLGLEKHLEGLQISNNGLPYVPSASLSILKKLYKLDISHNKIRVIQDSSFKGFCLKYLDLSGNPIQNTFDFYNGALRDQETCLEYLHIRSLGIGSLPRTQLKYLDNLKLIDASHNRMSNPILSPRVFDDIRAHRYVLRSMGVHDIELGAFRYPRSAPISLDLSRNDLTALSFVNNASDCTFYEIDVRNNPVKCNCQTTRALYSGTVGVIRGNCANRNERQFTDPKLRRNLETKCGAVKPVQCPYWNRISAACNQRNSLVILLCCVYFISVAIIE